MSSTILTPTAVTREAAMILHNECEFVKNINKDYDKDTEYGGQKRGATLKIRLPNQYTVRSGWPINLQETSEESVDLVVATVRGVDVFFTDAELAQSLDNFSKRVLQPAMSRLATEIDSIAFETAYKKVYNLVGTAGTTPSQAAAYLAAGQKLGEMATPRKGRNVIINPAAEAGTVNGLAALFNPPTQISKQTKEGAMAGNVLGFDWYGSQNCPVHTCGSRTNTTPIVGTNSVEGASTLSVTGAGAGVTYLEGDVFTISAVNAVNPDNKRNTGSLMQFVITETCTADGGGAVTLKFSPAVYASGAKQNVVALPLQNASIVNVGTASTAYPMNLAFHPEFATFATAKLEMPSDVNFKAQEVMDGISLRILRNYDINSASYPCRIDVLCGIAVVRPSMACRIIG